MTGSKRRRLIAVAATVLCLAPAGPAHARDVRETFTVTFDRWATGPYPAANASTDFGNATGWDAGNTYISNGRLRATLEPGRIGSAGGAVAEIDVTDGTEYEMQYTVNFHSRFDWSRGGKVGWGFAIGAGAGGCTRANGSGASMRLMWYTDDSGRTSFRPYLYHAAMPSACGDSFGASYPPTGSLQRARNYLVQMRIRSNTGTTPNGRAVIRIDGTTVLDVGVQWTADDTGRAVREVLSHTFRGGSQDYWASDTIGYVYYDNFSIRRIA
jgi:hypothetical protein